MIYCLNCDRFLKPEQLEQHKETFPHHILTDKLNQYNPLRLCDNLNCKKPTQLYHRVILDDRINTHATYYFCNLKCLRDWINNGINKMTLAKGHEYPV